MQRQAEQEPSQSPRVRFAEQPVQFKPTRKIVTSPTEAVVESTPPTSQRPTKQVTPILKKSKFVTSGSIAERVKARHNTQNQSPAEPELSIAEQVVARRCQKEQANLVLDHETGKILKYRQLLRHPKFKEVWSKVAANEFGRLAKGIKRRVEPTSTIEFIHKSEIPRE